MTPMPAKIDPRRLPHTGEARPVDRTVTVKIEARVRRSQRAATLAVPSMTPQNSLMLLFTHDSGPRSIDDRDIVACYADYPNGSRQCAVTVVLANGVELSGFAHARAVADLRARLNDCGPPAAA